MKPIVRRKFDALDVHQNRNYRLCLLCGAHVGLKLWEQHLRTCEPKFIAEHHLESTLKP